ncbi:MAG: pyruvate dehydrogenase [Planctomycetes bacterium]|nr:pyruvate dehydrogenase [Planctomycetota bacterium]
MTLETIAPPPVAVLQRIADRAFAQTMAVIHHANHRPDKRKGDPKVGGHPASCASSIHLLGALHLAVREPQDFVACKPHASPVDHTYHHLLQLFRDPRSATWIGIEEAKRIMTRLRKFPLPGEETVFQSYHARSDPDSFHFLPSGSVGIPQVASIYLALAYRYARDHGWKVPENAHFWSMMGDSEFREGSVLEALPDVAERGLTNCTWIVDYNRQNLDGTRIPNERGLQGSDCDRMEKTALAHGWKVIQVRHGRFRDELFARPGGAALKQLFEGGLSDYEYQMLLFKGDAAEIRRRVGARQAEAAKFLKGLSDQDVLRAFADLGGHCMEKLVATFEQCRGDDSAPYLVIVHTIKGYGLECAADPSNHSALPSEEELKKLLQDRGLTFEDAFALFPESSPEGRYLAARRERFRAGIEAHERLRRENRTDVRRRIEADGGLPEMLGIDLSLFPLAHTQWMWGQIAAKLVRIGTNDEGGPQTAVSAKSLSSDESRWKTAADMVLTLSPDVGTSTNISPGMDKRIYGPDYHGELEGELHVKYKHPELTPQDDPWTRHIRFEIAEANCMSAAGALGKMGHYVGIPLMPMMTVYDFFIKRALDQLYYNLYWGSEFVILGTPSGTTLSSEGAQHSWKSDIQIPNLVTWEPTFAIEMDWILSDALRRQMLDDNEGRRGVLVRAVTRGVQQSLLLKHVRMHARSKVDGAVTGPLKPEGGGPEWGAAHDESTLPARSDAELLARVRADCLAGGYRLIDWSGYQGYEPGDNVVEIFAMGALAPEACEASWALLERGVYANVTLVSSPELLLGILGEADGYRHLRERLGVTGDLFATAGAGEHEAGLLSIAGRRVPIVAVCDGEAGLLDNIGSIVGVKQQTLAVRKFSKCGRPDEVYAYQHLDTASIVAAAGEVLAETALEDLRVSPALLERLAGRSAAPRRDWRELWPDAGAHGA